MSKKEKVEIKHILDEGYVVKDCGQLFKNNK